MIVREEGDLSARLRLMPGHHHANMHDSVHGGAILALIDTAMFAAVAVVLSPDMVHSVTLDLATQFIGAGQLDRPLDVVTQVLKETGRLIFVRGLVEQEDHLVASFTGTLRKPGRK